MKKTSGIVKTSRGVLLDINRLSKINESEIAITGGGLSMNARGDILGHGGKVIKTREDLERAYNIENEKAAKHVQPKHVSIKRPSVIPDDFEKENNQIKQTEEQPNKTLELETTQQQTEEFTIEQVSSALQNSDRKKRKIIEE